MDQELIAFLDERFRQVTHEIATKIDQRFEQVDQRFERIEAHIDQRFEQADQRFEGIEARLEGLATETHQTRILVEDLHDKVKLLAEGVMGLEDKVQAVRTDLAFKFDQVQNAIAPYYVDLDRRVKNLEERAAREGQNPLDVIRKLYGKTA